MLIVWYPGESQFLNLLLTPEVDKQNIYVKRYKSQCSFPKLKPGDVCLCMGSIVFELLKANGLLSKNKGIAKSRETPILINNKRSVMLVTYDPNVIFQDYKRKVDVAWDIKLACRLHNTRRMKPVVGNYTYVKDFSNVLNYIDDNYNGKRLPLSVDLETHGLYPYYEDKHIESISFTYKVGQADLIRFKNGAYPHKILKQINVLLNNNKVMIIGANLKFDFEWMYDKWGLKCSNFKFDTLLVGSLLNENRKNSLETHSKEHTFIGGYDLELNTNYDKSHMELVPDVVFKIYAGGDTDACLRVAKVFKTELLKDKKLTNFYINLLHPSSQAFGVMERRGMFVDALEYDKLEIEVKEALRVASKKAFSLMSYKIITKYKDDLKLTRPAVLKDFMFGEDGLKLTPKMFTPKLDKDGNKKPSTALEHFELFSTHKKAIKFIKVLREFNSAKKTLSTYITGFKKHIRPDGKFHPTYILHVGDYGGKEAGAKTGRTACTGPAFQTIPKRTVWAKPLRRVYIAPKGYTIVQADYSQGELKIAACQANETNLIKAFLDNVDVHSLTASALNGLSLKEFMRLDPKIIEALRSGAKCLSAETEVLTPGGWCEIKNIRKGDVIVQWSDENTLSYTKVLKTYEYKNEEIFSYRDRDTELHATKDHIQVLFDKTGKKHTRQLKNFSWELDEYLVPHAGILANNPTISEEQTKLLVAVQADGNYSHGLRFGFKKVRKVNRLISILTSLNITYNYTVNKNNVHTFYIAKNQVTWLYDLIPNKTYTLDVWRAVHPQVFLDELRYWDGQVEVLKGGATAYCSYNRVNLEIVQLIAVTAGRKCTIHKGKTKITIAKGGKMHGRISWRKNKIQSEGKQTVYCVSVETGAFLTKLNGKVTVTHNCANFGLLYGMGWRGFKIYAKREYGLDMTDKEAQEFRNIFLYDLYPNLLPWHERCKEEAREYGYVRSPLGRIRHLPLIHSSNDEIRAKQERMAINATIQSTLSDLTQLAMAIFYKKYPELYMFGMCHDALYFYVKTEEQDKWLPLIKHVMENLPLKKLFNWKPPLKFTVDLEISNKNMAELESINL